MNKKNSAISFVSGFKAFFLFTVLSALISCAPVKNRITDRMEKALPTAVTPSAVSVDDIEEELEKADKLRVGGNDGEALRIYQKIIENSPKGHRAVPKARQMLARTYYDIGEYEPAIRELKAVLSANSRNPSARFLLIKAYMASDRPDEALKYTDPSVAPYCRWKTLYSLLSRINYARFRISGERKYLALMKKNLQNGLKEVSSEEAKLMLKADLALVDGRFEDLSILLQKASGSSLKGNDRVSAEFLLAALKKFRGLPASKDFRRVAELTPEKPDPGLFPDVLFACLSAAYEEKTFLDGAFVEKLISQVDGGLRDPEMIEFAERVRGLVKAEKAADWPGAVEFLEKMAHSAEDESIEGDYYYDTLYRPYILSLLYGRAALYAEKAGLHEKSLGLRKKQSLYLKPVFPPVGGD